MALQDCINAFQSILNRSDCTDAQAQTFLLQSISRIQRKERLPSMERVNLTVTTGPVSWISVPLDLLEIIDVIVPNQFGVPEALHKLSYRQLQKISTQSLPQAYARLQGQIWIAGPVPTGATIQLVYYGEFAPFASVLADNEITASAQDLVVYGGLSYAGDSFDHPSAERWEGRFMQLLGDVQDMAEDLENNGGPSAVQNNYHWE